MTNVLIWSNEHQQWWAANSDGYVDERSQAGIYSMAEAIQIVHDANFWTSQGFMESIVPVCEEWEKL